MDVHIIYGPPGTGKTSTLMGIMQREIEKGLKPNEIAFLTFTREARRIALVEARRNFGLTRQDLPYFGTLHSMCFRTLDISKEFLIRDANDLQPFADKYAIEFAPVNDNKIDFDGDTIVPDGLATGDKLLHFDHWLRHKELLFTKQVVQSKLEDINYFEALRFIEAYDKYKKHEDLLDFTDLLSQANKPLPVKVVFVDEAQDLSNLQWNTLFKLSVNAERMYIAGDDDQAIFSWAGASPERFISMRGNSRVLRHSYRLPSKIHNFAVKISDQIKHRKVKIFLSREYEGSLTHVNDIDYLDIKRGEKWLLLVRNHYLAKEFASHVRNLGLPYELQGEPSIPIKFQNAVETWDKLRQGKYVHPVSITEMCTYISPNIIKNKGAKFKKFIESKLDVDRLYCANDLVQYNIHVTNIGWQVALTGYSYNEMAYFDKVRSIFGTLSVKPDIRISTIHAAKGSEEDNVAILGGASSKVLEAYEKNTDDELRVMYVAATRARNSLTLVGDNELLRHMWYNH